MITLPIDATDEEILALVRVWVERLADGKYETAQSMLVAERLEHEWTPSGVEELISSYKPPYANQKPNSRVTLIREALVHDLEPRASLARYVKMSGSGEIGIVDFDLPVNGVWSDLTATLLIKRVKAGLALELYDIHVL